MVFVFRVIPNIKIKGIVIIRYPDICLVCYVSIVVVEWNTLPLPLTSYQVKGQRFVTFSFSDKGNAAT